ncbi:hypothetical protein KUTeg_011131 [Tegillarca granosa]|uniref:Uncharacterized protein n=1 Tax=Tegillarca granosa TaxID=220873 RepID=A0ABQ9F1N6_TEGGR|nr:hypothetical protein KUTeg_011131 [Tegillarca granosa]
MYPLLKFLFWSKTVCYSDSFEINQPIVALGAKQSYTNSSNDKCGYTSSESECDDSSSDSEYVVSSSDSEYDNTSSENEDDVSSSENEDDVSSLENKDEIEKEILESESESETDDLPDIEKDVADVMDLSGNTPKNLSKKKLHVAVKKNFIKAAQTRHTWSKNEKIALECQF